MVVDIKADVFFPFSHEISWENVLTTGHLKLYGVRDEYSMYLIQHLKVGDKVRYSDGSSDKTKGLMVVTKEAHQDPTTKENWLCVDLAPISSFMYGTEHNIKSITTKITHFIL